MNPPKLTYEELEDRLTRAEELISALKGTELDAIVGQEDVAFLRARHVEEQNRKFQAELERRVVERTNQLRELALELTQTEQRERQRLAEILHDHVQQLIAGAKLRLNTARADLNQPGVPENLEKIEDLLKRALKASRTLSRELCPPDLYSYGLMNSLDWLARNMLEIHDLKVLIKGEDIMDPESESLRILIFQSVREVLFNVVKHADTREALVEAGISETGHLRITVSDKGIGFDAENPSGPGDGTGYGLFSIQERMTALGGSLRMHSKPGEGTRIELIAPLSGENFMEARKAEDGTDARNSGSAPLAAFTPPEASRTTDTVIRLMIADDHKLFRDGLVSMLSSQPGIQIVAQAKNGLEAVDLARQCQPDVVIMDISMPGLNGIEATRIIASELPDVCIIGLSMHADDRLGEQIRAAGARQYLTKDVPFNNLVNAIRELN